MNYEDVLLPNEKGDLIKLYILINHKINEYVSGTTKIFAIIFCEMDFYESVLARIRIQLSDEDMVEMRKHDAIWDW